MSDSTTNDAHPTEFPQPPPPVSLRDYFATMALSGMLASGDFVEVGNEQLAQCSYKVADAMLAERAQAVKS